MKISIIVPIRSGENYLKDCFASLQAQTFTDFEVIVVCDRFPKETASEIAKAYPSLNVRIAEADGEGVAAARNTGLKLAAGEYVYLLDADDYLEDNCLKLLLDAAEENGADLVSGRFLRVRMGRDAFLSQENQEDDDTAEAGEDEGELAEEEIDPEDNTAAGRLIKKIKKLGRISALRILVKRETVLDNEIFFDESYVYYSDIPWVAELLNHYATYAYVDEAVYYKRGHNDPINDPALSQIKDDNRFDEMMRAYADAIERAKREDTVIFLNRKLIKYYTGTFALSMKRKPEKIWRGKHFKTISALIAKIDDAVIREYGRYKRKLCKAAKKQDRDAALRTIKRRLFTKKLKRMFASKNARCKTFYVHLFANRPMKKNYVLCESFFGKNYADSPKYIYEYLQKHYPGKYKFVWVLDNKRTKIPGNPIKIHRYSMRYAYYLAVCKYYVFNMRQPEWIQKKEGQTILETWHGIPIKRLMFDQDEITGPNTRYKQQVYNQTRDWDYLVSPNPYCTEIFKSCFMFDGDKIIETGYPRNDLLHSDNADVAANVRKKLGIPADKKIILYAPTFRDNEFYAIGAYKYKQALDFDLLQQRLGDEYVLLMRTHYIIADAVDTTAYKGFIYNVSKYDDINELYLISDILITDYSSVSFDFANLRRPMLYFTYDLEQYRDNLRGFYIDIEKELPGPLLFTSEEVVDAIERIDEISEHYKDRYDVFYDKYCGLEDGNCAKRVVEAVFQD